MCTLDHSPQTRSVTPSHTTNRWRVKWVWHSSESGARRWLNTRKGKLNTSTVYSGASTLSDFFYTTQLDCIILDYTIPAAGAHMMTLAKCTAQAVHILCSAWASSHPFAQKILFFLYLWSSVNTAVRINILSFFSTSSFSFFRLFAGRTYILSWFNLSYIRFRLSFR